MGGAMTDGRSQAPSEPREPRYRFPPTPIAQARLAWAQEEAAHPTPVHDLLRPGGSAAQPRPGQSRTVTRGPCPGSGGWKPEHPPPRLLTPSRSRSGRSASGQVPCSCPVAVNYLGEINFSWGADSSVRASLENKPARTPARGG